MVATVDVPKVRVLLASRNGSSWIAAQIDTILSQKGVSVNVMVQDDCSTDATPAILAEQYLVTPDSRVALYRNEQPSGSAGANFKKLFAWAEVSDCDYVAFSDQDDLWMPTKLFDAVEALRNSGASGYSSAVEAFWPDGKIRKLGQSVKARQSDFLFEGAGQGCTFVLPVSVFKRVQAFCTQYPDAIVAFHYHDWLVYLLVRAWDGTWYFDTRASMYYRQHENNEIGARGNYAAVSRRLQLLSNGWYRKQVVRAVDIFKLAGGTEAAVGEMSEILSSSNSLSKRLRLVKFSLRHGRRRMIDRFALAFFSLAGWL